MPGTMTLTTMPTGGQDPMTALAGEDAYLVSDWPAVQTRRVIWSPDNVIFHPDGSFDLALTTAPDGTWRPYLSGEVASVETGTYGTWTWNAQVPRMVAGAVFGMFTFQADAAAPRVEFDFEFVGADTTKLELNVHMAGPDGRNVSLAGGPLTVDLGFDAAAARHVYAVTVTEGAAVFTIDGTVVATCKGSALEKIAFGHPFFERSSPVYMAEYVTLETGTGIDWDEREKELEALLAPHRSNGECYDVLIPGSGGKDSFMQAHLLKYKYGMTPLTVTWARQPWASNQVLSSPDKRT